MSMVNVGDLFKTNGGEEVTVIRKGKPPFWVVRYNDDTQHEQYVKGGNIVRGKMRNPFTPSVFW
jgi:hypothetical protein